MPERADCERGPGRGVAHFLDQLRSDHRGYEFGRADGEPSFRFRRVEAALRGERRSSQIDQGLDLGRSEEHTSELQSLMRISYAVFCLKKKIHNTNTHYYVIP